MIREARVGAPRMVGAMNPWVAVVEVVATPSACIRCAVRGGEARELAVGDRQPVDLEHGYHLGAHATSQRDEQSRGDYGSAKFDHPGEVPHVRLP